MATAMDQAAALRVTEQAADQGDARAMANLGYMKAYARTIHLSTAAFHRMDGTTMARENADEVKYYRQAANAGDALGQTNLGVVCLLDTDRTTGACDDTSEAAELFRRASENGFPRATVFLAYMTEQGLGGLQKDIGEADLLYRRAYEQGDILGGVFREEMYNCKPLCDP